ncbi:hypothetical protein E2P81_ATG02767 [Venturia nashicola]|nr:hypothetical protein E2P81_ATG02767 [Venturia nashicola]
MVEGDNQGLYLRSVAEARLSQLNNLCPALLENHAQESKKFQCMNYRCWDTARSNCFKIRLGCLFPALQKLSTTLSSRPHDDTVQGSASSLKGLCPTFLERSHEPCARQSDWIRSVDPIARRQVLEGKEFLRYSQELVKQSSEIK